MSNKKTKADEKSAFGVVDYDVDSPGLVSTQCSIFADTDLKRGEFVRIGDGPSYFLAEIIDGPYYVGRKLDSDVKAKYVAEISSFVEKGIERGVLTRPVPGTVVETIADTEVQRMLGITGEISLGSLATDIGFQVKISPATMSRHIGVFGTTGSGKSNTIQVLMEEACHLDFCVMVFDVEGEYVRMDEPTDRLIENLAKFNRKPTAVEDLKVYVPNPSSSGRVDANKFGIRFKDVDKSVFAEVAGLSRLEQLYFEDLVEKVMAVMPESEVITLSAVIDRLAKRLRAQTDNPTLPPIVAEAHTTLYGKLTLISGLNMIDVEVPSVRMEDVVKPGRVTVVDFSDASDHVRNIVIAELVEKAWKYKIQHPESAKLLLVIEEAHAFISREKRDRMLATLMLLIETARRGRKRGLSLGIVTQQPTHLPTELLELCNTRIIHRTNSTANIDTLKESTGNVPEGMWNTVTSLGRGEAILSTPQYYSRALSILVRPAASKRIATE